MADEIACDTSNGVTFIRINAAFYAFLHACTFDAWINKFGACGNSLLSISPRLRTICKVTKDTYLEDLDSCRFRDGTAPAFNHGLTLGTKDALTKKAGS